MVACCLIYINIENRTDLNVNNVILRRDKYLKKTLVYLKKIANVILGIQILTMLFGSYSLLTFPSSEGRDTTTAYANYCGPCSGNETDTEDGHCQRFVYILSGSFMSTS